MGIISKGCFDILADSGFVSYATSISALLARCLLDGSCDSILYNASSLNRNVEKAPQLLSLCDFPQGIVSGVLRG